MCCLAPCVAALAQTGTAPVWVEQFVARSQLVLTPDAIEHLLFEPRPLASPRAFDRPRGGASVYARVAPAVVVVRTAGGHGTGFLISADGQLLTNAHVIANGLAHDPQRNASYAWVNLGRLGPDGAMQLDETPLRAFVLKLDPGRDLALLALEAPPAGLAFLALAPGAPPPGERVMMIGHPAAGMLWTFRSGEVSAVGRAPTDLVDAVLAKLTSRSLGREAVTSELAALPARRVLVSSCGANPGDSGGPLVDERGAVVGVSFAIPGNPSEARFTYHVHRDEVAAFLADRPRAPLLVIPEVWDAGPRIALEDFAGGGRADALVLGGTAPEAILFDLDRDTPAALLELAQRARLRTLRAWDFELAVHLPPLVARAFYDTDADGALDLILTGPQLAQADTRFWRDGPRAAWHVAAVKGVPVLAAAHLRTPALRRQAELMVRKVQEAH